MWLGSFLTWKLVRKTRSRQQTVQRMPEEFGQLLCFQHCEKRNIFCFQLPNWCPLCKIDLRCADLRIPPFKVPSPFAPNKPSELSLVIKPTFGCFIKDYKKGDPLHIGLTDANRTIAAYDENGIQFYSEWPNCLTVSVASLLTGDIVDLQRFLDDARSSSEWSPEKYDEENNNCFDFVLAALNSCQSSTGEKLKKDQLTQEYIMPITSKAIRAIAVYRAVVQEGWFLSATEDKQCL